MSKEKEVTSDIKKKLEKIKVEAEAKGITIKTKISTPKTTGKVKGAVLDLRDKIVKLHILSHIKSIPTIIWNSIINVKDKCIKINDDRKERKKVRQNIDKDIISINTKINNIAERVTKIEKKLEEKV